MPTDTLRALDYTADTRVPATFGRPGKAGPQATATIQVTYSSNFPPEAIEAYEFAADIWERHLSSPVVIHVEANWDSLEANVLGAAGTTFIGRDFPGAPLPSTWYPYALVETLSGQEDPDVEFEITSVFNSNQTDWYFGTDMNTPPDKYNFATVVLHELAHGLGFFGSFVVGEDCPPGDNLELGCWGYPPGEANVLPIVYDRFTEDKSGIPLLNTEIYPNPSEVLGDTIRSDNVLFDSPTVREVNEGVPVNLYAPNDFDAGSSFSHLDEASFADGGINSLMTPFLARQETVYTPGPVTCGIMKTIGWPLGEGCESLLAAAVASTPVDKIPDRIQLGSVYPNPVYRQAAIPFSLPAAAHVQLNVYDVLGRKVMTVASGFYSPGVHRATLPAHSMAAGLYILRAEVTSGAVVDVRTQTFIVGD